MASHYLKEMCELPRLALPVFCKLVSAPQTKLTSYYCTAQPESTATSKADFLVVPKFSQRLMEPRLKFHPFLRSPLVYSSFRKLLKLCPF